MQRPSIPFETVVTKVATLLLVSTETEPTSWKFRSQNQQVEKAEPNNFGKSEVIRQSNERRYNTQAPVATLSVVSYRKRPVGFSRKINRRLGGVRCVRVPDPHPSSLTLTLTLTLTLALTLKCLRHEPSGLMTSCEVLASRP